MCTGFQNGEAVTRPGGLVGVGAVGGTTGAVVDAAALADATGFDTWNALGATAGCAFG